MFFIHPQDNPVDNVPGFHHLTTEIHIDRAKQIFRSQKNLYNYMEIVKPEFI